MSSTLDSTYGVWLVSLFLETILYGCGLFQTWLYFHWYANDPWRVRFMVILLVIFETLQIAFFFASTYICLIKNFGNISKLFVGTNWMDSAQLLAGYLSAFTVQLYFAYCIYVLDRKNKLAPILITMLALIQIGAGIAQTIAATELASFVNFESTKHTTTLQSAAALCCDIAITVCLVRVLSVAKSRTLSSHSMLNILMINAINRGMLTAFCAALNMILFLSIPNTFYFFLGLMSSSKLYMNSALATLNTRQHVMEKAYPNNADHWPPSMQIATTVGQTTSPGTNQVTVHSSDPDLYCKYKNQLKEKTSFINGMV